MAIKMVDHMCCLLHSSAIAAIKDAEENAVKMFRFLSSVVTVGWYFESVVSQTGAKLGQVYDRTVSDAKESTRNIPLAIASRDSVFYLAVLFDCANNEVRVDVNGILV